MITVNGVASGRPIGPHEQDPEHRGYQNRHNRQARARSVEPRLDDVIADEFDDDVQGDREQEVAHVVECAERTAEYGDDGRDPGADIGDEPEQRGEQAPQECVGMPMK